MRLGCLATPSPESISHAKRLGFDTVEFCVGWCDADRMDRIEDHLEVLGASLHQHRITVSAIAVHGNAIGTPASEAIDWLSRAVDVAQSLGCHVITSTTGRDSSQSVEDNLPLFRERYEPVCQHANARDVRVALETWPGRMAGHGPYQWASLATTPELWQLLFEVVPSPSLGLTYDPSHLVWQEIDYALALTEWQTRIVHLRANDIVIHEDHLRRVGIHGSGWWEYALPGLGQIDWPSLFTLLQESGYRGNIILGNRDARFAETKRDDGLRLGHKALRPLVEAYR